MCGFSGDELLPTGFCVSLKWILFWGLRKKHNTDSVPLNYPHLWVAVLVMLLSITSWILPVVMEALIPNENSYASFFLLGTPTPFSLCLICHWAIHGWPGLKSWARQFTISGLSFLIYDVGTITRKLFHGSNNTQKLFSIKQRLSHVFVLSLPHAYYSSEFNVFFWVQNSFHLLGVDWKSKCLHDSSCLQGEPTAASQLDMQLLLAPT